jgi:hypothetical protein
MSCPHPVSVLKLKLYDPLLKVIEPPMNRSEVSGMTVVSVAASEEVSEPESPDLPSGFFHLNSAGIYLEA